MLKRIKFAAVPVEDQERALDFYTKKLGLKIFTDQSMGDSPAARHGSRGVIALPEWFRPWKASLQQLVRIAEFSEVSGDG